MKKFIFLDLDGVLNTHDFCPVAESGTLHRDKVQLLNNVLTVTDARIVLSSAWRYLVHRGDLKLAGLNWLLRSHGIMAGRLVGITRPDTMERWQPGDNTPARVHPVHDERGAQITDWLRVNHPNPATSYAVVDDMDLGIRAAGHPFVQTDTHVGLTPDDAEMLISLLMKPRG